MRRLLLASAAALACAAFVAPASADPMFDGVAFRAEGTYGNVAGFPTWSANGSVNVPLDWNGLSIDGMIGDSGLDSLHTFNGGGNLVWSGMDIRLAGSVLYNRLSSHGSSIDETQYGGGAEWYATPWLTAGAFGGGISGSSSGSYVGGRLKGYFCPDAALDGFVNYTSLSGFHQTDYGAHAEWLPMEDLPVSLGATYTHTTITGFHTDSWMLHLNLYLNDSPASTLHDRQQTGTLDIIQPGLHLVF